MQAALKKIMTKNLVVIHEGSSLKQARDVMEEKRFRHLPVVNEANEITGILVQNPLLDLKYLDGLPVEEVMSRKIYFIDKHAPLRHAIFKIIEKKTSFLLVVDQDQQVLGIITTEDLIWYLSTLLEDAKGKRFLYSSLFDLQTIGEVAQQMANAGI